jgi:DNA modification methylase
LFFDNSTLNAQHLGILKQMTQVKKKPTYQPLAEGNVGDQFWRVFQGDSANVLKTMQAKSVDCVVTSPPYFWLRDYGVDGQIGLEERVDEYVLAIDKVMQEIYRVLKDNGVLFLNLGDTYYSGKGESQGKDRKSNKRRFGLRAVDKSGGLGINLQRKSIIGIPWRVATQMCQGKWILRSPIIWHKQKGLPEAVLDRPRRSYEFVFMFVKQRKYFFNREPLVEQEFDEDVWTITPRIKTNGSGTLDTAPFPDELVERCLKIGCPKNGVVLDPFSGSGTTMRVAFASNRSALGIELNAEFCEYISTSMKALQAKLP